MIPSPETATDTQTAAFLERMEAAATQVQRNALLNEVCEELLFEAVKLHHAHRRLRQAKTAQDLQNVLSFIVTLGPRTNVTGRLDWIIALWRREETAKRKRVSASGGGDAR